ncbi:vanin-like protein 2 isoform X3 [Helicoverpa armigera]|uniref:vanin-like protein 2 isoform X3 n=1 Tax=Helicoverpa armigera TaxID=29058 RepID=UPI0030839A1E
MNREVALSRGTTGTRVNNINMRLLYIGLLFSFTGFSVQKSTPQDDHYVGAVVEYLVTGNVATNLVNYANLIKEAAEQGADIVVFPEDTLTNSSTYFTVPIYGALKNYPIPALYPTMFDEFMVAISTAARANQIYVVINGRELMDCTIQNTGENCPEEKSYMFKTNVVFDRTGAVIDRFRKINLFRQESYTPALKPDLGVFTTDFGVTFGHFICFDLMFQIPAVQVVQKMNIKDVIFPTMWYSELPYLTAVQIQEAYAYALDVNFLGSGANNVRVGSGGSGIYSGKAGALISIMPGLPTTKVLVAKVPKVPGEVSWPYPGPIYDEPFNMNNMRLIVDPSLASHVTKLLEPGTQEFTLVDKDVSCTFRVTLSQRNSQISVRYRAFIQDGTNTYARREIGVVACLLVACKNDNVTSCSYRYTQQEENEIEKLEIEMNTYRNTYNDTLDCNNIEYFPVTVRYNKFPLSPKNFTFTSKEKDQSKCEQKEQNRLSILQKEIISRTKRERLNFKINVPQRELIAFGIWGRIYTRDVDHNKEPSDDDVQKFNTLLDDLFSSDD